MITRFFSTSKPIHLVIVAIFAFIVFSIVRFGLIQEDMNLLSISIQLGMYLVVFMSISVLAFFVTKNNLTQRNGYKILFFVMFLAILTETLKHNNILLSNLFIILALRRIFSLRNNLRVKKKLFDAAIWITIASLFHFWAILFFSLILGSILLYSIATVKNWVVPLVGVVSVLVILISYFLLKTDSIAPLWDFIQAMDFDYSKYNDLSFIIRITIILSFSIWASFFYAKSFGDKPKLFRSSHLLVIYTFIIALIVALISPNKNGSEFIFIFAPLAIIMANFIEGVSERWFSEVFIWLLLLTPIVQVFL